MEKKTIDFAIYGAGGLGREVCSLLKYFEMSQDVKWSFIGFFDDGKTIGEDIQGFGKCLGGINELNNYKDDLAIALCFGSAESVKRIHEKITKANVVFPNLTLPDLWISDKSSFRMGEGNIICGKCTFTTNVSIGNFNLFNGEVTVGHDVEIGNYNMFMPGCRISGEVKIADECLFGAMSFVRQGLNISGGVVLSPLSALLSNTKTGCTYIGNPAKRFKF